VDVVQRAQDFSAAGEYDAEQVYAGELDSLYRLADQHNIPIPPQSS
jgi:hypothetical protein